MENKDKPRFATMMAVMGENFQKEPSESLIEVYWRVLGDMSIGDFEKASLYLINTRRITGTFPVVAEIREAAGGGSSAIALRIVTAWDKFMYALNRHAPYDSVQFDDPIICHIVRQWGGWTEMGDWPASETKWKRKEFEKLYEAYAVSDNLPEPDQHLIGLTEANNRALYPEFVPKPILITGETGRFLSLPYEPVQQLRLAN